MRSVRQEALSVAVVMSTPVALLAVFPYGVFGFKAVAPRISSAPSAAFVHLTAEEEAEALKTAKTSWQAEGSADRGMRAYLPLGELPEDMRKGPILGDRLTLATGAAAAPVEYGRPAWSPSQAAEPPAKIAAEEEPPRPQTFSKEELLELER